MRYLENHFIDVERDLNIVPIMKQERANEDARATIDATIDAFFKDKAKVIGPFDADGALKQFGNNIAGTKTAPTRISYRDKDNPKLVKYRFEEKPATLAHIDTAVLCTRDENGATETPDGDTVKPWVHLIFEDGSQIDLAAIVVKAKKGKDAPAAAAN